ncbi:ABC transporter ATP-binding protein [Paenactinomyces guangxiensis]|uniref:ABC transporter ATP-binding protein n=1 Tax=Paenactinomyces guangxiensis TaxID=1490290 RepID=A0A7W1WRU1_9BACL|nr:ABC transporter ATP-binding protein [Paenactinomyces guangxiensis]MBA4494827.1 ABC transporter ATP-binding protein [Paenactinomyces guangxiensis]MBH8591910.1 ABC transporter ATP-binding protein [Paenactinomyces guangxiensis]
MFQFEGVSVRYGKETVLQDLSFLLESGPIYGIVGPDGAGKTTLLQLLVGLLSPTEGFIKKTESVSIGFVSEHFGLYEEMSLQENLLFYGTLRGLQRIEAEKRADELLKWASLEPFADRAAGNLSGGMKRKLAIIAAILHHPACLVLDEPTHGVDPVSRREIWRLIQEIKQTGTTVIVSTQYLDEVPQCDEVLLLFQGKLMQKESPLTLVEQFPFRVFRLAGMRRRKTRDLLSVKQIPGVVDAFFRGADWILLCEKERKITRQLEIWKEKEGLAQKLEKIEPSFEDVFIHLMRMGGKPDDSAL